MNLYQDKHEPAPVLDSVQESTKTGAIGRQQPQGGSPPSVHEDILSCVVQTRPGHGAWVADRLDRLVGVEVHGGAEIDKLVLTIEDVQESKAADLLSKLNYIEGVINTTLIYHYAGQYDDDR